tara:strand:+ start:10243 stop:11085 length:843 start_codon:yes stop_codon:yes gene_type:complete
MITIKSKQFYDCEQKAIKQLYGKIRIIDNVTSNTLNSLKYLYFRKHYFIKNTSKEYHTDKLNPLCNTPNSIKDDYIESSYKVIYEKRDIEETFDDFVKTLRPNQYHYYDEMYGKINSYVDIDFFKVDDYGPGDIVNIKSEKGIRRIIVNMRRDSYDDITYTDSIPYKYCQVYGYMRYMDIGIKLELDEKEAQFLFKNEIFVNRSLDEVTYGALKKIKNTYFIFNKNNKWQRITIIPNSYGRDVGYGFYESMIKDNKWDINILLSPLEKLNLITLEITQLY